MPQPTKPKRATPKKVEVEETTTPDNKYAPKEKIGARQNKLRTSIAVTKVGLGGLTVETR